MRVRQARPEDVITYVAFARTAQDWLRSCGLKQYVPAAHAEYAAAIHARVAAGTLYAIAADNAALGFFSLQSTRSEWWPVDDASAMYLAGMVVDQRAKGRGVGGHIIRWSAAEANRLGYDLLRLDCHAGNPWLCAYYEKQGFKFSGHVTQHPGYDGCLYELAVVPVAPTQTSNNAMQRTRDKAADSR